MDRDDALDACLWPPIWVPMMLMIACWLGLRLQVGFRFLLCSVLKPFCFRILLLETCMISEDVFRPVERCRLFTARTIEFNANSWNIIAQREPDAAATVALPRSVSASSAAETDPASCETHATGHGGLLPDGGGLCEPPLLYLAWPGPRRATKFRAKQLFWTSWKL